MAVDWLPKWLGGGEKKSISNITDFVPSLHGLHGIHGISFHGKELHPRDAMEIYQVVSPVAQSVDMVSDTIAAFGIGVREGDSTVFEHDALTFLEQPNPDQTQSQFLRALTVSYMVTGNNFILANGAITKPPLEITITPPQFATLGIMEDRHPSKITLSAEWDRTVFRREQKGMDPARYLNGTRNELYWIRRPNPFRPWGWGYSDLTPALSEITQFRGVSQQNESLLESGGRVAGVLSTELELNPEQYARVKEQIDGIHDGTSDSRVLVFEGGKWLFKEMGLSPKDMDFLNQKGDVSNRIFQTFNIPLALINTDSMTFNNYQIAIEAFVDNAVMPWALDELGGLTRFFQIRGLLNENESLVVDPQSIRAHTTRRTREALMLKNTGAVTPNEIRDVIGRERLGGTGGDFIYQGGNLVPVAADAEIGDQPTTPNPSVNASDDRFKEIMRAQVKPDGTKYTEDEIDALTK